MLSKRPGNRKPKMSASDKRSPSRRGSRGDRPIGRASVHASRAGGGALVAAREPPYQYRNPKSHSGILLP